MMKVQTLAEVKIPKWKPFTKGKEFKQWKKDGSHMTKLTKKI